MLRFAPAGIARTERRAEFDASSSTTSTTTAVNMKCTWRYTAPEFHKTTPPGSKSVSKLPGDVWGFGITALECLVGSREGSLKSVWGNWNPIKLRCEMDIVANQKPTAKQNDKDDGSSWAAIEAHIDDAFKNVQGSPDVKLQIKQQLQDCLKIPTDVSHRSPWDSDCPSRKSLFAPPRIYAFRHLRRDSTL